MKKKICELYLIHLFSQIFVAASGSFHVKQLPRIVLDKCLEGKGHSQRDPRHFQDSPLEISKAKSTCLVAGDYLSCQAACNRHNKLCQRCCCLLASYGFSLPKGVCSPRAAMRTLSSILPKYPQSSAIIISP